MNRPSSHSERSRLVPQNIRDGLKALLACGFQTSLVMLLLFGGNDASVDQLKNRIREQQKKALQDASKDEKNPFRQSASSDSMNNSADGSFNGAYLTDDNEGKDSYNTSNYSSSLIDGVGSGSQTVSGQTVDANVKYGTSLPQDGFRFVDDVSPEQREQQLEEYLYRLEQELRSRVARLENWYAGFADQSTAPVWQSVSSTVNTAFSKEVQTIDALHSGMSPVLRMFPPGTMSEEFLEAHQEERERIANLDAQLIALSGRIVSQGALAGLGKDLLDERGSMEAFGLLQTPQRAKMLLIQAELDAYVDQQVGSSRLSSLIDSVLSLAEFQQDERATVDVLDRIFGLIESNAVQWQADSTRSTIIQSLNVCLARLEVHTSALSFDKRQSYLVRLDSLKNQAFVELAQSQISQLFALESDDPRNQFGAVMGSVYFAQLPHLLKLIAQHADQTVFASYSTQVQEFLYRMRTYYAAASATGAVQRIDEHLSEVAKLNQ